MSIMMARSRRPARYVSRVIVPDDVHDGDTLSFRAIDGVFREGLVMGRAWDVGSDLCWWVDLLLWDGNEVEHRRAAVAKTCCGSLQEIDPNVKPTARVPMQRSSSQF